MPAVVEARTILCAIPLDTGRGESKGVWLQRVSRLLGITPSQGKKIYYQHIARMDADRLAIMRDRFDELQKGAAKRRELLDALDTRLATIRSGQGSGNLVGDSARASPTGGGSDRASTSGVRKNQPAAAAVPSAGR